MMQAGMQTARKVRRGMPIMPAVVGITGRSGPMNRPASTLFQPWRRKKSMPRTSIPG
jgi:hypothetical protein